MIRSLVLLAMVLCILGWLGLHELERRWEQPLAINAEGLVLTVAAGDSLRTVTSQLHEDDVMPYPQLLLLYGRWTGKDAQIKRGEYQLHQGMTSLDLLNLMQSGKVMHYQVTLPEGITLQQALAIWRSRRHWNTPSVVATMCVSLNSRRTGVPQKACFPLTAIDMCEVTATGRYCSAHICRCSNSYSRNGTHGTEGLPYETPYEALIMASIIERETGVPQERQKLPACSCAGCSRACDCRQTPR